MWRKLQRNVKHRWVGGVCSGFARFIGLDNFPARMLIRFLFVTLVPMFWWVYLLLWIVLPPQKLYEPEEVAPPPKPKSVYRPQVKVEVRRLEAGDVLEMTKGKVSDAVFERVVSIDRSVRALMPQLTWWRTLTQPELATVKRAALDYFPQTLQHYLSLPRDYAENHKLTGGLTPEAKLLADLRILESTLSNVLEGLFNHEKFSVPADLKRLNERFSGGDAPGDNISRALEDLVTRIRGKVPDEILEKVMSIRAAVTSALPQIDQMGAGMTQEAYNLRQTALEYLPDALEKYLGLPGDFAETHVLSNGKTAKETLLEQLEILDDTVKSLVGDAYQDDAEALLIHGRFLKEKFAGQKFTLPADKGPTDDGARIKFPDLNVADKKKKEEEKARVKL